MCAYWWSPGRIGARRDRPSRAIALAFSANWPNAPHRVLRSCVAAAEALTGEVVGETLDLDGSPESVRRFDCLAVSRETTGRIEAMPLWAGESVGAVKRVQPAAEILRELIDEAESLLKSQSAPHDARAFSVPGPLRAP